MTKITYLPMAIKFEAFVEEFFQYLLRAGVLLDFTVQVETDHVTGTKRSSKFKSFVEAFLLSIGEVLLSHMDSEMHYGICVVLFIVLYEIMSRCSLFSSRPDTDLNGLGYLVSPCGHLFEHYLEILSPSSDR